MDAGIFQSSDLGMDDWEECVFQFAQGNLEEFVKWCTALELFSSGGLSEAGAKVSKGIKDISEVHVQFAFDENLDQESRSESSKIVAKWMRDIPRLLLTWGIASGPLLLIPVEAVLNGGFSDKEQSQTRLKQFYDEVDIMNIWYRMDPRVWGRVAKAYRITFEVSDAIRDEVDLLSNSGNIESIESAHLPVRERLSEFLRDVSSGSHRSRPDLHEFLRIFQDIEDLYDLIDLEVFLLAFPDELFLRTPGTCYKPSFARKLALTAVKQWVHGHQHYKKNRDTVSRKSFADKEEVIRACINAHLDITNGQDRDCEYFYSYLRKQWLADVTRSNAFHVFEIFDHIDHDSALCNQLLFQLEDDNRTEDIALLLALSEPLRCERRRRMQLDDPLVMMLMSFSQTARKEHLTWVFGPVKEGAFILPFSINLEDNDWDVDSPQVLIIDQAAQVERMIDLFDTRSPDLIGIDVFFKCFWSCRLERPVPSVLSLCWDDTVFIIMTNRLSPIGQESLRHFLRQICQESEILKIMNGCREHEKMFALWSFLVPDPFRPSNDPSFRLDSYLDLCHVFDPRLSFAELVSNLLGGLIFCNYEENSDWSKADSQFLRESQLHFIASRAWLSLQIFHTIDMTNIESVVSCMGCVDFSQIFKRKVFTDWTGSIDQVAVWVQDNPERLHKAQQLVFSSPTQEELRELLTREVFEEDDYTADVVDDPADDDLAFLETFCL